MPKVKMQYDQSRYIYQGYESRDDYMQQLADEHGIDVETVYSLSELLGEDESWDGLVSACRDAEGMDF